jgi:hypothetical protein
MFLAGLGVRSMQLGMPAPSALQTLGMPAPRSAAAGHTGTFGAAAAITGCHAAAASSSCTRALVCQQLGFSSPVGGPWGWVGVSTPPPTPHPPPSGECLMGWAGGGGDPRPPPSRPTAKNVSRPDSYLILDKSQSQVGHQPMNNTNLAIGDRPGSQPPLIR